MTKPTDTETRAIAFRVSGRVQGVAFRWFGRETAQELGVSGWIRNRADGDVEGEAFAESSALESFLGRLRQGPRSARVEDLRWEEIPDRDPTPGFEIRF